MADALAEGKLINDIKGTLTLDAIVEFMELWRLMQMTPPLRDVEDSFTWRLTASVKYTTSSAYQAFFFGTEEADCASALLKNAAPPKEQFFTCLVIRDPR